VFDLLTRPEPKLTKAEEIAVKQVGEPLPISIDGLRYLALRSKWLRGRPAIAGQKRACTSCCPDNLRMDHQDLCTVVTV
jgi:hypothetical protein